MAGGSLARFSDPGGNMTRDPRRLIATIDDAADIMDAASGAASTGSTFFANLDACGVAVDSNFTASSQKTILSVSAAGELCAVVTPTLASASDTCAVEITVDGVVYTITFTATGSAQRGLLGASRAAADTGSVPSTSIAHTKLNAAKKLGVFATGTVDWGVQSPVACRFFNLPRLRFESSLVVKMTTSQNITSTTNQERQSGCAYILDL